MTVIVTIPAHNEEETVGTVVKQTKKVLAAYLNRVIVVCDRCTDMTAIVAEQNGAEVHYSPKGGLANVFRYEMELALKCNPTVIVHIDADGQYEPKDIPSLLLWIERGYQLVLGNRLHHKFEMPTNKYLLNKLGASGYSAMLNRDIPDITTGFRAFTPQIAMLPIKSKFTYTQEQVWRASKARYKIMNIPVMFRARVNGNSRLMKNVGWYLAHSLSDFRRFGLENTTNKPKATR